MNKPSKHSPVRGIMHVHRLSLAIALTLFAAGPLYAQTTSPTAQTSDQTTQTKTTQGTKSTTGKKAADKNKKQVTKLTGMTVTGYASSLSRAQQIKRYADTVVDAISAEDISSLPETSVTEALQRVPGVAVSAFGVAADPDHFSIQGSDISLEGLPYTSTLFNGREVFSAGGGQGLNFATVSPELVGSVVVKKNQTADMIEGGIAGSVNLNTRKPFNSDKDTQVAFTTGMYWGSLSKKGTPQFSGLFSHNFDTDIGRFGFLINMAYDKIKQTDNAISLVNFQRRCNGCTLPGNRVDNYPGLAAGQYVYLPIGGDLRTQDETSTRFGHVLAFQWESPDKAWQATLEWDRVSDTETTYEHTLQASTDGCAWSDPNQCDIPLAGTTPVFDSNGVFQSGTVTALPSDYSYPSQYGGLPTQLNTTGYKNRYVTNDYSFKLKWRVNDRLNLSLDAQDTHSQYKYSYYYIRQLTNANWYIATHGDDVPTVKLLSPDPNETTAQYFSNPANTYWAAAQDSQRYSWGNQRAFRLDGDFTVDKGPLNDIQFGFRHTDQNETVQSSAFNYVAVSTPSPGVDVATAADTPNDVAPYHVNLPAFSNGDFGVVAPYFNKNPLTQFWQSVNAIKKINQQWLANTPGAVGNYYTNYDRERYVAGDSFVPGTYYLPQEIASNEEKTNATYVRMNFGNGNMNFLSGLRIRGNVGIRFIHTQDNATGYLILPNMAQTLNGKTVAQYCNSGSSGPAPQAGTFCALTSAQQQQYMAFANGAFTPITTSNAYNDWLPSFNLAIGWNNDLVTRFAFSKAIYRPSLTQLQAGQSVSGLLPYGTHGSTEPTVSNGYTGANPYLKPITSYNFDLTQEWYFGKVGMLSATLFWKKLNHTVQYITNVVDTSVTNNGVTYPEQYTAGLDNLDQEGSVHGVELSYQQQFNFLPGWLAGFGTQMNYTYIKPIGLSYGVVNYCPSGYVAPTQCINQLTLPPSELSRDTANFIIYYDKGPLSARLAWNWRSAFLITGQEADYPFLPVMAAPQGRLDASVSYAISKHVKISLQASNVLNSTFKTREIVNTDGVSVPKGFFRDDTRYNLRLRASF